MSRISSYLLIFITSAILVFSLCVPLRAQAEMLASGSFAHGDGVVSTQARVVSYNIHGPFTRDFEGVASALEEHPNLHDADLFSLQEVHRNRSKSGHRDVARDLAQQLGMHFVFAVELEYEDGDGQRGLALLSRHRLSDPARIVLPGEGPKGRRRIALGATLHLGSRAIRVYNVHLETSISLKERQAQIETVLASAREFSHMPTIILGDFNTFHPGAREMMFEVMENAGFRCPLRADKPTFQTTLVLRLKLDWLWLRGIEAIDADVEGKVRASDHRPLWVTFPSHSVD